MGSMFAYCFFRCHRNPPSPPRAAIEQMIAELADRLEPMIARPIALTCECWAVPPDYRTLGGNVYARITIDYAPGEMLGTLMRWYEWQHPRWEWASAPPPKLPAPAKGSA